MVHNGVQLTREFNASCIACLLNEMKMERILTSNQTNIANNFNNFFTNIGPYLAKQIPQADGSHRELIKVLTDTKNHFFFNKS